MRGTGCEHSLVWGRRVGSRGGRLGSLLLGEKERVGGVGWEKKGVREGGGGEE